MAYTWPDYPVTGTANFEYNARLSQDQWVANSVLLEGRLDTLDGGTAGLTTNVVGTSQLVDLSVTTDKLALLSVGAGQLSVGAVTEGKIGSLAVTESKLGTAAVTVSKISNGSVTEDKIDEGAVTNIKMADNSVNTAELVDEAVTEPKLAADNAPLDTYCLTYTSGALHWAVQGVGSASGLEYLSDDAVNYGWRLIGGDPANYGNIGLYAVDFSISIGTSTVMGSTGPAAVTYGYDNINSGAASLAGGTTNTNSSSFSIVAGANNDESGDNSMCAGNGNTVDLNSYNSLVVGYDNELTTAPSSIVCGGSNIAQSSNMIACGLYSASDSGAHFVIGNGTSPAARSNKVVVRANGVILINDLPATDPGLAGQLWNDSGTLKISAG